MNEPAPYLTGKETHTTDKGRLRANEILGVAREVFSTEGYAALSMRGIASRIGISLSAIQHYYPNKKALVEAMLLHALDVYQAGLDKILESMKTASPEAKFAAALDMFLDDAHDPVTNGMFYELWSLATREKFAADILDTIQTRGRKTISRMIRDLGSGISNRQCDLRAVLICAQFQGLMSFIGKRQPGRNNLDGLREEAHSVMMALATNPDMQQASSSPGLPPTTPSE